MFLFPVTIWYMPPYLIIQGAMEGIITRSYGGYYNKKLYCFLINAAGTVFLRRLFWGWICPMGGMQEYLFSVNVASVLWIIARRKRYPMVGDCETNKTYIK